MALHLAYIEKRVGDTATVLLQDRKRAARSLGGTSEPHVIAVQLENCVFGGIKKEVHRLFVKAKDSGDYMDVGWVLVNDVDNCMICNSEFSLTLRPYHCRACGNVVCSKCSPETAIIREIIHLAPQRVCAQCDYGQAEVSGVYLLQRELLQSAKDRKANVVASKKEPKAGSNGDNSKKDDLDARQKAEDERLQLLERLQNPLGAAGVSSASPNGVSPTASPTPKATKKLITITPLAGFVIKSKRPTGDKVFINVCCHESVVSADEIHLSSAKQAKDKNGGVSPVYDAVVSVQVMQDIQKDRELRIQQEVGLRIIDKLGGIGEQLDQTFTTPMIKGGYKGDGPTEMQITVESMESSPTSPSAGSDQQGVAAGNHNAIVPVPGIVIKTKDLGRNNMKIFINLCTHKDIPKKEKPVLFTGQRREYAAPGESAALVFDAVVHPSTLSNIMDVKDSENREFKLKELCGKVIKVLKAKEDLPPSVDDAFTLPNIKDNYKSTDNDKVAAFVLPVESEHSEGSDDIHIVPYPGFVLQCSKANIHDKEPIFVNVCHHDRLIRAETQKYYMLSATSEYAPHPELNIPVQVYTAVVHSAVLEYMVKDETGEAEAMLCGEVITLLNDTYGASLSYDVSRPAISGGVLSVSGSLPKIVNVAPSDKEVAVDYSGMLHKQGHGRKNWTHRRFFLQGRSLKYFADRELKGTVDIKDSYCEDCPYSECNAPKESFPFKIITPSQTWYIYADSDSDRVVWKNVIEAKVRAIRVATTDSRGNRTLFRRGYLKKEGHFFRNWQKRYFVLDMGMLKYYEKESASGKENPPRAPYGEKIKGMLSLAGATVTKENSDIRSGVSLNRIYISGKDARDLLLEADTEMALDAWYKDIQSHIEFADNNPHLVDVDDSDASIASLKK